MKYRIILLHLFILLSCEKEIDVKFPFEGSRFFLFGELESDKTVQVKVDKTYPPNGIIEFSDSFLDSTKVKLYQDDIFFEYLSQSKSNKHLFFSSELTKIQQGHSYRIIAENPYLPEASSANQELLNLVNLDSVWLSSESVLSPLNPSIPTRIMYLSLSSIPADVPFIFFEITGFNNGRRLGVNVISTEKYNELENPCMPYGSGGLFVKTDCYDRDSLIFDFYVEMEGGTQSPPFYGASVDNIEVKVSSVNEAFLDYHRNTNASLDFFSVFEGVKLTYSDISNGYGAVLTKNSVTKKLRVQ